jgi:hypothetical protein
VGVQSSASSPIDRSTLIPRVNLLSRASKSLCVVEACNVRGKSFGSESTAAISMQSAETIAETSRKFGQKDDVTVVSLTLDAAPASKSPAFMLSGEPART